MRRALSVPYVKSAKLVLIGELQTCKSTLNRHMFEWSLARNGMLSVTNT